MRKKTIFLSLICFSLVFILFISFQNNQRLILSNVDNSLYTNADLPILILNNNDLNNSKDYGYGNESHPYVIQNKTIDANGTAYGIRVIGTTAHFIIQNCTIYNATSAGIGLGTVDNATLTNNTLFNNTGGFGIELNQVNDVVISNNTLFNNTGGSGLDINQVDGVEIFNNTMYDNAYGLSSVNSDYVSVFNNTAYGNTNGLFIVSTRNSSISNNWVYNNDVGIQSVGIEDSNVTDNKIYNNLQTGIYSDAAENSNYLRNWIFNNNQNGIHISFIIGGTVKNCTFADNIITYHDKGINMASCVNSTLINNTVAWNKYGFYLHNSNNTYIINNNAKHNYFGIFMSYGYGFYIESSFNVTLINNTVQYNGNGGWYYCRGIFLWNSFNCSIKNNTIVDNWGDGIYLESSNCKNNTIAYNTLYNNSAAVTLFDCGFNNISYNIIGYHRSNCFVITLSSNNTICNNSFQNLDQYYSLFIRMYSVNYTNIFNNTMDTGFGGIYLDRCLYNNISQNTIRNTYKNGISLDNTNFTYIALNNIRNSEGSGFNSYNSHNTTLINNIINDNKYGMYLKSSDNTTIHNNTLTNNFVIGIYLSASNNTLITNNTILYSVIHIYAEANCTNTQMSNNTYINSAMVLPDMDRFWIVLIIMFIITGILLIFSLIYVKGRNRMIVLSIIILVFFNIFMSFYYFNTYTRHYEYYEDAYDMLGILYEAEASVYLDTLDAYSMFWMISGNILLGGITYIALSKWKDFKESKISEKSKSLSERFYDALFKVDSIKDKIYTVVILLGIFYLLGLIISIIELFGHGWAMILSGGYYDHIEVDFFMNGSTYWGAFISGSIFTGDSYAFIHAGGLIFGMIFAVTLMAILRFSKEKSSFNRMMMITLLVLYFIRVCMIWGFAIVLNVQASPLFVAQQAPYDPTIIGMIFIIAFCYLLFMPKFTFSFPGMLVNSYREDQDKELGFKKKFIGIFLLSLGVFLLIMGLCFILNEFVIAFPRIIIH